MKILLLLLLLPLLPHPLSAQQPPSLAPVRAHVQRHQAAILHELAELLRIPNHARDSVNIRRNAAHLVGMLERRGVSARLLETPGSPPAVLGELRVPGAARTVMLYAHYDGQPVRAEEWSSDAFAPTLRDGPLPAGREIPLPAVGVPLPAGSGEWRLYARSASDDKSPIVAMLAALDALRAAGISPSVNVKFYLDGEEEAGDDHLRAMLVTHRDALAADVWIFGDGPVHQTRRPQVVYGVRGVVGLELTVYGPVRALHSGHYGNWAPNPAVLLVELLAGLRDGEGRVKVPGFYDDVRALSALEREALAAAPVVDSALLAELALARAEADGRLVERIMRPALNVRGLQSGGVGAQAANAIPTHARASIDFRLVPDLTPSRVRELVEAHLRATGWHVVHQEPSVAERRAHARVVRLDWEEGYPGIRTPMDLPVSRAIAGIVDAATAAPLVRTPMLGGSLPMHTFEQVLGVPLIIVPIVNHDNTQHAANENLRLQNLWDGIEIYAALLAELGRRWRD